MVVFVRNLTIARSFCTSRQWVSQNVQHLRVRMIPWHGQMRPLTHLKAETNDAIGKKVW